MAFRPHQSKVTLDMRLKPCFIFPQTSRGNPTAVTDLPSHLTALQEFFDAMNDLMRGSATRSEPAPVQRKPICPYCNGTGARGDNMCNRCDTNGNVELEGDDWNGYVNGSDDWWNWYRTAKRFCSVGAFDRRKLGFSEAIFPSQTAVVGSG